MRRKTKQLAPPPQSAEEKERIKAALAVAIGRPRLYTDELGIEIAELYSRDTRSLQELCDEHDHWPAHFTLYRWAEEHPIFEQHFGLARKVRADVIMAHATDETAELIVDHKFGSNRNRQRAMLNNMTQMTAQRLSRDWALRTQHEIAGPGGKEPVGVNYGNLTTEQLRQLIRLQREAMGESPEKV